MIEQCGEFAVVASIAALIGGVAGLAAYLIITRTGGAPGHAVQIR